MSRIYTKRSRLTNKLLDSLLDSSYGMINKGFLLEVFFFNLNIFFRQRPNGLSAWFKWMGLNSMKSVNKGFGVVLWSLFELQSSSFNTFNI